jgi:hypothetical protein
MRISIYIYIIYNYREREREREKTIEREGGREREDYRLQITYYIALSRQGRLISGGPISRGATRLRKICVQPIYLTSVSRSLPSFSTQ